GAGGGPGPGEGQRGKKESPPPAAPYLSNEVPVARPPVHLRSLGVGISASLGPPPPLPEPAHPGVVKGHLRGYPDDRPAPPAQAQTDLVVLGSEHRGIEAADLLECLLAHHRDAAAGSDLADRPIPLDVADPVVDRRLGRALAQAAGDGCRAWILSQLPHRSGDPALADLAVAIDELDELDGGIELEQPPCPLVAGPCRSERNRGVELDHDRAERLRDFNATVGGA